VRFDGQRFEVLSAARSSQDATHRPYGGVVPELATRDHVRLLPGVARRALEDARLSLPVVDVVAATRGPGLAVALMVGHTFAKCLAALLDKPFLGVNHLHGHLISPFIYHDAQHWEGRDCVCLLVSGGHTMLVFLGKQGIPRVLGTTRDDAAGEAFDKAARLLGLPYPGGSAISRAAEQGNSKRFDFPRPMLSEPGLEFSFSGLKTAVRLQIGQLAREGKSIQDAGLMADLAASVQAAIVETLVEKSRRALEQTGAGVLTLAGGVAANAALRVSLQQMCEKMGAEFLPVHPEHSTDNAVMIAAAAGWQFLRGRRSGLEEEVHPQAGGAGDWLTSQ
jgi:N6-L-threonylcarbamoyladenine synthase